MRDGAPSVCGNCEARGFLARVIGNAMILNRIGRAGRVMFEEGETDFDTATRTRLEANHKPFAQ